MVTGDQDTLYLWPAWIFGSTILICGIPFKAMIGKVIGSAHGFCAGDDW